MRGGEGLHATKGVSQKSLGRLDRKSWLPKSTVPPLKLKAEKIDAKPRTAASNFKSSYSPSLKSRTFDDSEYVQHDESSSVTDSESMSPMQSRKMRPIRSRNTSESAMNVAVDTTPLRKIHSHFTNAAPLTTPLAALPTPTVALKIIVPLTQPIKADSKADSGSSTPLPQLINTPAPALSREQSKSMKHNRSFSHHHREDSSTEMTGTHTPSLKAFSSDSSLSHIPSRLLAPTMSSTQLMRPKKDDEVHVLVRIKKDDVSEGQFSSPLGSIGRVMRRRSYMTTKCKSEKFEVNNVAVISPVDGDLTLISTGTGTGTETPTPTDVPVNDSWESVTEQLRCDVCGMIFPCEKQLIKHINYSQVHSDTMKKLVVGVSTVEAVEQIAGVQYQLVYSGSKYYWRTNLMIEVDIYHHVEGDALEVVIFNYSTDSEMERIYVDASVLTRSQHKSILESVEISRKKIANADRFAKINIDTLYEKEWRNNLATHVLSRLKLRKVGEIDNILFEEHEMPHARFERIPKKVVPVFVQRSKRTHEEELRSAYESFDFTAHGTSKSASTSTSPSVSGKINRTKSIEKCPTIAA